MKNDLKQSTSSIRTSMSELITKSKIEPKYEKPLQNLNSSYVGTKVETDDYAQRNALAENARLLARKNQELQFNLEHKAKEIKRVEDNFYLSKQKSEQLYDDIIRSLSNEKTKALQAKDREFNDKLAALQVENETLRKSMEEKRLDARRTSNGAGPSSRSISNNQRSANTSQVQEKEFEFQEVVEIDAPEREKVKSTGFTARNSKSSDIGLEPRSSNSEVDNYKKQIEALSNRLSQQQIDAGEKESKVKFLEDRLTQTTKSLENLTREIQILKDRNNQLDQNIQTESKSKGLLMQSHDKEMANLKANLDKALKEKQDSIHKHKEQVDAQAKEYHNKILEMEEITKNLEKQIYEKTSNYDIIQAKEKEAHDLRTQLGQRED